MSDKITTDSPYQMFQDSWLVYKKIVDGNHMFHQQINRDLNQFCRKHFAEQAISIIELGCGDASQSCQIFSGSSVRHYLGYDLSGTALGYARENLQAAGFDFELVCSDMLTGLTELQPPVDIIFCSYSLHHLSQDKKTALFARACDLLSDHGVLIMVDIIRDENQTLADYYDQYLNYADQHWHGLSADDLQLIRQHVTDNDFPEQLSTLSAIASSSGFNQIQVLNRNTWHQTCVFHKS